jgi:hypothetical protein
MGNWIRKNAENILIAMFIVILFAVIGSSVIAGGNDADTRKRMLEKCTPDPSQYECQLYLVEKGRQSAQSNAFTSGLVGGLVGGAMAPRGR